MGACFTVNLELTFLDEAAAVKAMQEYIHTANADFGLEKHKKRSVGTDKSEDLIKICFSSCDGGYTNLNRDGNKILFISDLDTYYSWKTIMLEAFEAMAAYLADDSQLDIYPDNNHTVWQSHTDDLKGEKMDIYTTLIKMLLEKTKKKE